MAEIDPIKFYKYPEDETLDVEEHGENIHSTRTGRGVYSEVNGNLDRTNFIDPAADYESTRVRAEHIRRGETHITAQERGVETLDYFDQAFGQLDFESKGAVTPGGVSVDYSTFVPISGCSARVYLPYDCAMVLWQWSFFSDPARAFLTEMDKDGTRYHAGPPTMIHKAFLNGVSLSHTKRYFPKTWYHALGTPTSDPETLHNTEGRNCRHWDMHHLAMNVTKGWHEISAQIYIGKNEGPGLGLKTISARGGRLVTTAAQHTAEDVHHINSRLTFGIRNARALAMMETNTTLLPAGIVGL